MRSSKRPPKNPPTAKQKAIELLARREYSQKELRQALLRREFLADEVDPVIEELAQRGWQSDARALKSLINSALAKGEGVRKIKAVAMTKGFSSSDIDEQLGELDHNWRQSAQDLVERKFGPPPYPHDKQIKIAGLLIRKGFAMDQAYAVARSKKDDD